MSIQNEVAFVLDTWTQNGGTLNSHEGNPREIAAELADAGLLAPDLPPMTGVCWWRTGNARIDVTDEGAVDPRIERKNYTPERARKIALNLLAAAEYAEGEGA